MNRKAAFILLSTILSILLSSCIPSGYNSQGTGEDETYTTTIDMSYTYKTNVSEADVATGLDPTYLFLANKSHPMGISYGPAETVRLTCPTNGGKTVELEARVARALYAMLAEMQADGVTDIAVTSGYRTYLYQEMLFRNYLNVEKSKISDDARAYFGNDYIYNNYVSQGKTSLSDADAEAVVLSYSARPGTSEHQTGLCVDFVTSTAGLTQAFENTDAFRWLSVNAYRFGFILRYPADKVDITKYSYEPWHYRFVGREAATEITLRNLTLEEFLGEVG